MECHFVNKRLGVDQNNKCLRYKSEVVSESGKNKIFWGLWNSGESPNTNAKSSKRKSASTKETNQEQPVKTNGIKQTMNFLECCENCDDVSYTHKLLERY